MYECHKRHSLVIRRHDGKLIAALNCSFKLSMFTSHTTYLFPLYHCRCTVLFNWWDSDGAWVRRCSGLLQEGEAVGCRWTWR